MLTPYVNSEEKSLLRVSYLYTPLEAADIHLKPKMTISIYIFTHSVNGTRSLKSCVSTKIKKNIKECAELYGQDLSAE